MDKGHGIDDCWGPVTEQLLTALEQKAIAYPTPWNRTKIRNAPLPFLLHSPKGFCQQPLPRGGIWLERSDQLVLWWKISIVFNLSYKCGANIETLCRLEIVTIRDNYCTLEKLTKMVHLDKIGEMCCILDYDLRMSQWFDGAMCVVFWYWLWKLFLIRWHHHFGDNWNWRSVNRGKCKSPPKPPVSPAHHNHQAGSYRFIGWLPIIMFYSMEWILCPNFIGR